MFSVQARNQEMVASKNIRAYNRKNIASSALKIREVIALDALLQKYTTNKHNKTLKILHLLHFEW